MRLVGPLTSWLTWAINVRSPYLQLLHAVKRFDQFDNQVRMWVYEEKVGDRNLSDIINEDRENVKYLPGVKLPRNIEAVPSLIEATKGATMLVFVTPHQFLEELLPIMKPHVHPKARASSLIKGVDFDENGLALISDIIRDGLGIECGVLMGANVARDIGRDQFAEATVGDVNPENGLLFKKLYDTKLFKVNVVDDSTGVELCGALKNIVAVGVGFCDGLGYGTNTKAALIRIGLDEMMRFCQKFYDGIQPSTFFESCGVADLITTCFGGRNRMVAEAFVTEGKRWEVLEKQVLGGQKLQGTLTCVEVYQALEKEGCLHEFPFFRMVYDISFRGVDPAKIVEMQFHEPDEEHFF